MKKTIVMIAALMAMMLMSGCQGQPMPSAGGSVNSSDKVLSDIDTTALGIKFNSLVHIGHTITIRNSEGVLRALSGQINRKGK